MGFQPFEKKIDKQKKKQKQNKTKKKRQKGEVYINSVLVWSKSNSAVEAAFQTITFHKYDLPHCFFLHTELHFDNDCFSAAQCVSDVTVGGRSGGSLPENF